MSVTEYLHSTRQELTSALADTIERELMLAVESRGDASLVVSGGSTPRPLFQAMAQRRLPWEKITVTLADERWVDTASNDSNEGMLRKTLLQAEAVRVRFVPLKNGAETALDGRDECERALAGISRPFDQVILGMGDDGHTASLFPSVSGSALDTKTTNLCAAIKPRDAPHERMSLTARALLDSRRIILHIVGDDKWRVYEKAMAPGNIDELPVRVVLRQKRVPVDVYWSK